jgi:hypothetical protein
MRFEINEGPIDRLVRIVISVGLFTATAAGLFAAPVLYVALLFGTIALVTGLTGFCPTYIPFGFSTRQKGGHAT